VVNIPRSLNYMNRLKSESGLVNRIARNSTVVLTAKLIEISASLIIMMILSRMLSLARFGDFAFVTAVVLAFQPLVNLELNTILIREMAGNRHRERELLGGGLLLKLVLIVLFVVSAIALDSVTHFEPTLRIAFFLAVAGEIFQQLTWVYSAVFMARERMEFEPLLSLVFRLSSVAGVILVALLCPAEKMISTGFILVFLILASCQGLRAIAGMIIAAKFVRGFRIQWSIRVAKELISQSWIMGIATFCTGLSLRVDVFFLKYFLGSDQVALFHLPHMFTLQIQILAISAVTALFPVISRWGSDSKKKKQFQKAQDISIRIIAVFGLLIALTANLYPNLILRILGGSSFVSASRSLVILAWCVPILFLNYLGANLLTAIKKQQLLIYGASISLGLNVVLDYLWIPVYGITGAAVATLLSYGVQLIIVLFLLRKHTGYSLHILSAMVLPGSICVGAAFSAWSINGLITSQTGVDFVCRAGILIMSAVLLWKCIPAHVKQSGKRKTL